VNGAWLRATRLRAGLSQRAFARHLGLSAPYIGDIELNRRGCRHEIQMAYERLKERT
jgi:transcriptional regulator with XRE-family HTH domain